MPFAVPATGVAAPRTVPFESLPVAALIEKAGRIVAVNEAYETFMTAPAAMIVGRTVADLIGQFVLGSDVMLVDAAAKGLAEGREPEGQLWVSVQDTTGRPRSIRVEWHPGGADDETVIYLIDAEAEARAKAATDGLARAAGQLGRCSDEREVLERAADVLHARGLTVTTLLLRGDDPLLQYGPMRRVVPPEKHYDAVAPAPLRTVPVKREVLWTLNPQFHERRAAFFQDVLPLIAAAYPPDVSALLSRMTPSRRTVQAPLFVNDAPYGALVITGEELSPSFAGPLEMFAELVARAIENVRLRTELVQRERLAALGEAAAVMAHEVRNPIAAILNASALMQHEREVDAGVRADLLRVVAQEARRLERLVRDLLDLGRPLAPEAVPTDLRVLAERSVAVLCERGEADDVVIEVLAAEENHQVQVDPDLVQLAIWNVVRNAVQATPARGRVTVSVEPRRDGMALVVDDEGAGFPVDHADRVLEPFYTTRATGTGIGLALVRRVVDASAGSIAIERTPAGGGRFVMIFPRAR